MFFFINIPFFLISHLNWFQVESPIFKKKLCEPKLRGHIKVAHKKDDEKDKPVSTKGFTEGT